MGHSGTPPPIRALIADDHLVVRRGIGALLSSISGIEVVAEASTWSHLMLGETASQDP